MIIFLIYLIRNVYNWKLGDVLTQMILFKYLKYTWIFRWICAKGNIHGLDRKKNLSQFVIYEIIFGLLVGEQVWISNEDDDFETTSSATFYSNRFKWCYFHFLVVLKLVCHPREKILFPLSSLEKRSCFCSEVQWCFNKIWLIKLSTK